MIETKKITASIVVYKEDPNELLKTIDSFLGYYNSSTLYLIDNSPTKDIEKHINREAVEYYFVGKNIGFGAGHNIALEKIKDESEYHLILNPDVNFDSNILNQLTNQLDLDEELAFIAPKVLFPSGGFQNSCRRYPTFKELFFRRFPLFKNISKKIIEKGVYADKNLEKSFYAEYMTGCFHLYRTEDFVKIGGFDERYFLYMEDVDICKKIDKMGKKKMYYPSVHIHHVLKKGSSKSFKLFIRHTTSMIKYFLKWGF